MKKLFAICLLTAASFAVKAQSHISTGKYACSLVPKSLGAEKYRCPACAKLDEQKRLNKIAEDKRIYEKSVEDANKSRLASIEAAKKMEKEIAEKNKVTEVGLSISTSGSTSASNTSAQNPLSTTPATTTRTTIQETQRQAYEQAQEVKAARAELTAQVVTQAGSLVGGLLDDWNAASERKAQRREAERSAATAASVREERQKRSDKFEFVYLPLMDLAKKGDENARMILYFSSWGLEQESLIPLREQWLEEALTNKNIDALLMKAVSALNAYKKGDENVITDMEKIAEMGSVDAMVVLAAFYNNTGASGVQQGGNDPNKAMEWYKRAAEKGAPDAMHSLGMIYKYGRTNNPSSKDRLLKKWVVKYDIILDEKIAFDWFTKSLQPDYVESIYAKFSPFSSKFNKDSYLELADFYKKGKVVPKDEAKVSELRVLYDNYKYTRAFRYIE